MIMINSDHLQYFKAFLLLYHSACFIRAQPLLGDTPSGEHTTLEGSQWGSVGPAHKQDDLSRTPSVSSAALHVVGEMLQHPSG